MKQKFKLGEIIVVLDNDYKSGQFRGLYKVLIEYSISTDIVGQKNIDKLVDDGFLEKLEYYTMDICI